MAKKKPAVGDRVDVPLSDADRAFLLSLKKIEEEEGVALGSTIEKLAEFKIHFWLLTDLFQKNRGSLVPRSRGRRPKELQRRWRLTFAQTARSATGDPQDEIGFLLSRALFGGRQDSETYKRRRQEDESATGGASKSPTARMWIELRANEKTEVLRRDGFSETQIRRIKSRATTLVPPAGAEKIETPEWSSARDRATAVLKDKLRRELEELMQQHRSQGKALLESSVRTRRTRPFAINAERSRERRPPAQVSNRRRRIRSQGPYREGSR